ncbi:MAG: ketoacyl-ACP synthase III [Planctomycetota bacterium]|nr:ketoacyl-ACP synthase III [Planctomycetota bacterium]
MCSAAIYGTGAYVPHKTLTNEDFSRTLDTTDEWITTRTGIKERRIAAPDQATSDLCLHAARAALKDAGIAPRDLDLIIVGTITPDYPTPSTACILQQKLGLGDKTIPCFDLSAACSGFIYALTTASAYITAGLAARVLVVGSEATSRIVDYSDRRTCILFGDGAGAAVLGPPRTDGPSHKVLSTRLYADGNHAGLISIPAGGSARPASRETCDSKLHYIRLNGREVFRFGVIKVVEMIKDAMARHNLMPADVGAIIPHQANMRIIEAAVERLALPWDLFIINLQRYGNTSSASVPLALDEASRAGRLVKGKPVIMLAFGGGMTWASAVVEW